MEKITETEALINEIRKAIKSQINGDITVYEARNEYRKLLRDYKKLEKELISSHSRGFLKGLLYHHNIFNLSRITAIYLIKNNELEPIEFTGDTVLLKALPGMIERELETMEVNIPKKIIITDSETRGFYLALFKMTIENLTLIIASVTSSELFKMDNFLFCANFIGRIYRKRFNESLPVILDYINEISRELWTLLNSEDANNLAADHFILQKLERSFNHMGIYNIIDLSDYILKTLNDFYPDGAKVYALSPSKYLAIYDEKLRDEYKFDPHKIDFQHHGYNIPFKTIHSKIDSPESVYHFLEEL